MVTTIGVFAPLVLARHSLKNLSKSNALASVPRVWQIEVWLETTLEEAQRHIALSKGHFGEANQGVLVRCEVDDLLRMARLLAGPGQPFVIHHPLNCVLCFVTMPVR